MSHSTTTLSPSNTSMPHSNLVGCSTGNSPASLLSRYGRHQTRSGAAPSDALMLLPDRLQKCLHCCGRLQMVNPLGRRGISDKLTIPRRQPAMTEPKHPVAAQRTAPHGAILRPAVRISKKALDEAHCDPPVMRKKRQVDVNERISCREPLPGRCDTAKAINDPLISVEEVGVRS